MSENLILHYAETYRSHAKWEENQELEMLANYKDCLFPDIAQRLKEWKEQWPQLKLNVNGLYLEIARERGDSRLITNLEINNKGILSSRGMWMSHFSKSEHEEIKSILMLLNDDFLQTVLTFSQRVNGICIVCNVFETDNEICDHCATHVL